jgi:ribosomal protein L2
MTRLFIKDVIRKKFIKITRKDWQNSLAWVEGLLLEVLAMNPVDHPHGGKKYGSSFCKPLGNFNKKDLKLEILIKIILIIVIKRK